MNPDTDRAEALADLIARTLHAADLVTYRPDGTYGPGDDVPVVFDDLPTEPDRAVLVRIYPTGGDHELGVQITARGDAGDPFGADRVLSPITSALNGAHGGVLPTGEAVPLITYRSGASLGVDSSGRYESVASFAAGSPWRGSSLA